MPSSGIGRCWPLRDSVIIRAHKCRAVSGVPPPSQGAGQAILPAAVEQAAEEQVGLKIRVLGFEIYEKPKTLNSKLSSPRATTPQM